MSGIKRAESGASEVIGAVLLVSMVVLGGATVAAFVFGQPTPKEVPHVSFGVSLNDNLDILTLHHTGGDSLRWGEYNVTVYYTDGTIYPGTPHVVDKVNAWGSDGNMKIEGVDKPVGNVILSYIDGAGGETVLRRVPFEEYSLWGMISGYKYNVTGRERVPWTDSDPSVTINIYRKEGSDYALVFSEPVDANGHYSYALPADAWGVYRVEEVVPAGWEAVSPPHGSRQIEVGKSSPNKQVDFENRLLPVVTTKTTRPTPTPPTTVATTATTVIPTAPISGTKYQVDEAGTVLGTVANVEIVLERLHGNRWEEVARTRTDASGHYIFTGIPENPPAQYRLREVGLDPLMWTIYSPPGGIITGVVPGGTGYDFMNQKLFPDGIVMYLNKTVEEGCDGGHVVDGTTYMGDARAGDHVTINYQRYQFKNNEQFRFTIWGNQTSGELFVEHEKLSQLTFNVKFEVRRFGTTEWKVPEGFAADESDPWNPINIGVPESVSITAINKNGLNDKSTLTYRFPVCAASDTLLRLNGQVWCDVRDPPGNDAYLDFSDLHLVHDNRYGEGLNTMWIFLEPGYNYLLVQGVCNSP